MSTTPAAGNGPFEFMSASGEQVSIPLSAFSFNNGTIAVDALWVSATTPQPITAYLMYAVKEGIIAPAALAAPFPAMIVNASAPGASGNNISVTVAITTPASDPTQVQFSITVTETETYTGLTVGTVESVLGSSAVPGSSPGLVQVMAGSVSGNAEPAALSAPLAGTTPQLTVDDGSTPPAVLFTLVGKNSEANGTRTEVTITPEATTPPTFTLKATWTKASTAITLGDVESQANSDLGYEIKLSKPGSGAYSLPAAATTQLSGGSASTNASATLFTGQ